MSVNISTGWPPPPLSALQINNCDAGAAWLGELVQVGLHVPWESAQVPLALRNVSINASVTYVNSTIPAGYSPRPTEIDLLAWYLEFWVNLTDDSPDVDAVKSRALTFPRVNCSEQLCPALQWEGDPDVSGTGMMVSYYMDAGLATLFFAVLAYYLLREARGEGHHDFSKMRHTRLRGFAENLTRGFDESAEKYLDFALVYAAGYLLAALSRFVSAFRHYLNDRPVATYSLGASVFMSAFSIFPAILLQSLAPGIRRSFQRQVLWALIVLLFIIVNALLGAVESRNFPDWVYGNVDSTTAIALQDILWEQACDESSQWWTVVGIYIVGVVVLIPNGFWWLAYTVSRITPVRRKILQLEDEDAWARNMYQRWKRYRIKLRIVNGIVCGVMMWVFLATFHWYSNSLAQRAGESDKDTQWTFGQVLAPVAFLQIVFDIMKCELGSFMAESGSDLGPNVSIPGRSPEIFKFRREAGFNTDLNRRGRLSWPVVRKDHGESSTHQAPTLGSPCLRLKRRQLR